MSTGAVQIWAASNLPEVQQVTAAAMAGVDDDLQGVLDALTVVSAAIADVPDAPANRSVRKAQTPSTYPNPPTVTGVNVVESTTAVDLMRQLSNRAPVSGAPAPCRDARAEMQASLSRHTLLT
jgi:hypothetical protein